MLHFRKHLSPGGRDEAVARSCHIHQLVPVIVADDQRVNAVWSGKIPTDDKLLATIYAILDPSAASFSRLVLAVLLLADDSFQPLLADRSEQIVWRSLDVIHNPDSLVLDNKEALQERSTIDQRKACEVTTLPAQQIENVVMNPRCFSAGILQEIEIGAPSVIDGNDFSVHNRSFGQAGHRVHEIGKLPIQRFSSPREQSYARSRPNRNGSIT